MKTCTKCGATKALTDFLYKTKYMRSYCKACECARQRESKARYKRERGTPEYAARRICTGCGAALRFAAAPGRTPYCKPCGAADRKGRKLGKCTVCGGPCWSVKKTGRKCRVCEDAARAAARPKKYALNDGDWNNKRAKQAAYDKDVRVRKVEKLRDREPWRYMEFALGEYWKLDGQCQGSPGRPCTRGTNGKPKWIVGTGSCYSCATGRPRRIRRLSELRDAAL